MATRGMVWPYFGGRGEDFIYSVKLKGLSFVWVFLCVSKLILITNKYHYYQSFRDDSAKQISYQGHVHNGIKLN